MNADNAVNLTVDYAYIADTTTTLLRDTSGLNRDVIRAFGTLDASISFIHKGDALGNLRVAAFARDFLHKGGRLSNVLDAGVFYFGVVNPRQQFGIEATVQF